MAIFNFHRIDSNFERYLVKMPGAIFEDPKTIPLKPDVCYLSIAMIPSQVF